MSRVVVCGLGYVGLVIAVRAAEVGHDVIGLDTDSRKIGDLQAGFSYIEDVSAEQLVTVKNRFHPVDVNSLLDEITDYDIGIIAVPTPLRNRIPDLSYVESAGRILARYLRLGATIVLESTTYPGTTEALLANVVHEVSGLTAGVDYYLGFSPERIDPGNSQYTLRNTPKLVSGVTGACLTKVQEFYDTIVDTTVPVSSPRVAEITKLYENIFAHVNIALVNEMARLCHGLGIDVWEMINAGQTKGHSIQAWYPGPGVGGHCLPIDGVYLSWLARNGLNKVFQFAELAETMNGRMPSYVVDRVTGILNDREISVKNSTILLVGVAYKPGSSDLREAPALDIVKLLQERGAQVTVTDPYVNGNWTYTPTLGIEEMTAAGEYDLVVIVTNHSEYDYVKLQRTARQVFDTRHCMPLADNVVYL